MTLGGKEADVFDLTKIGISLAQMVAVIIGLWYVFSAYSELQAKNTEQDNTISHLSKTVENWAKDNKRSNDELREAIKSLSTGVVGKTPEGFHRRDCTDLVTALQASMAVEMAGRQYNEDARTANETLVRALGRVNCYGLQGFHSGVAASRWRVEVRK